MATMHPRVHSRIVSTSNTLAGAPRVIGTRITVERLCQLRAEGLTVDAIVQRHPELDCEDVWAAWSYAHHHRMDRVVARKKAS